MTHGDDQEELLEQQVHVVAAEQIIESTRSTGENNRASKVKKPGELLGGKYEIISILGEGGMGVVYKAKQSLLDKVYAIKLLNTERSDELAIKRFHAEAKAACELSHPNLITVFVLDVDDGHPFMVMDFVDGISLAELIRRKKQIPFQELIKIGVQICEGMAYAHERRILHRDLKPSNIMLATKGTDWHARVVDFGIAKMVDTKDHSLTRTGEIFGSPLYMSPEQAIGNTVDERSDIYSLGCLLFEALTGKPPFVGDNLLETMYMRTTSSAPLLAEALPEHSFPQQLQDALKKALATNPADRFQTMAEFREALAAASTDEQKAVVPKAKKQSKHLYVPLAIVSSTLLILALFAYFNPLTTRTKTLPSPDIASTGNQHFTAKLASLGLNSRSREVDLSRKLCHIDIDDDDINSLSVLPLAVLRVNKQNKITDKSINAIAKMHTLRELSLKGTSVTSEGVRQLQELPYLRRIDLSQCENIDDHVGETLGKITSLERVDLFFAPIGDECLRPMAKLNVAHLFLRGSLITNKGLNYIAKLPLTSFSMGSTSKTNDESLAIIAANYPDLQYLNCQGSAAVTDKGIEHLAALKHLTDLRIQSESGITDRALKSLAKIDSLGQIFLDESPIGDEGIRELSGHKEIHFLSLSGTKVTDKCIPYLLKMPSLKLVNLSNTKVSKEQRMILRQHQIKVNHDLQPEES